MAAKEYYCCQGCGRDTTANNGLCRRCSPSKHCISARPDDLMSARIRDACRAGLDMSDFEDSELRNVHASNIFNGISSDDA